MNFHQRNKNFSPRNNGNKNIFLSIVIVFFLIIVFSFSWTRNILFTTGTPLWTLGNDIKSFFLDNIGVLNSKTNLLKENDLLKSEIKSNEIDHAIFDVLKKENDDLKDILGRKTNDEKLILGTVLVKPYLSAYDTLIIDVGSSDGIIAHDEVLAEGNTFIGYISEVYNNTSKVTLYSSPGEKVKVLIGSNNIEKEAVGLGGGNFTVEVPKEIDISEGDNITMPSISPNVFGVVEKVESKESDSFQNVFFKNPINVLELKWVEVLAPNVSAPAVKK